jgi:hypothetical protein
MQNSEHLFGKFANQQNPEQYEITERMPPPSGKRFDRAVLFCLVRPRPPHSTPFPIRSSGNAGQHRTLATGPHPPANSTPAANLYSGATSTSVGNHIEEVLASLTLAAPESPTRAGRPAGLLQQVSIAGVSGLLRPPLPLSDLVPASQTLAASAQTGSQRP